MNTFLINDLYVKNFIDKIQREKTYNNINDNIRGKKSEEKQITLVGFFFGGKTPGYQFWTGAVASIHVLCRWCLPFPVRVSANPGQQCLLVIAYALTIFIDI